MFASMPYSIMKQPRVASPGFFVKPDRDRHSSEARSLRLKDLSACDLMQLTMQAQAKSSSLKNIDLHFKEQQIKQRYGKLEPITSDQMSTSGRLQQDGLVFKQDFSIRSYDLGPDSKVTMKAIMNFLQETAINHCKAIGFSGDGFGSTREMTKRNLIWVVRNLSIFVDRYPGWGDVLEVQKWFYPTKKYGLCHNWVVLDLKTGETIVRALSQHVMMNKRTRKLSKLVDEIWDEIKPRAWDHTLTPIITSKNKNLPRLDSDAAEYVSQDLVPIWNDFDLNQHISHIKYIDWILASIPEVIWKRHALCDISMQYRGECGIESNGRVLRALSATRRDDICSSINGEIEFLHSIVDQNGSEIIRASSTWTPNIV